MIMGFVVPAKAGNHFIPSVPIFIGNPGFRIKSGMTVFAKQPMKHYIRTSSVTVAT
jgi:hypothetical protein